MLLVVSSDSSYLRMLSTRPRLTVNCTTRETSCRVGEEEVETGTLSPQGRTMRMGRWQQAELWMARASSYSGSQGANTLPRTWATLS
jgi:hypothetical protein